MRRNRTESLVLLSLAGLYVIWAGLFIYRSSYISIDGQRYFGLFDDAMISMRYAWNFAHGLGLVWNAGQRVEGYSNLLMTLIMSVASLVLNKERAVLAVQVFGILTILATVFITKGISDEVNQGTPHKTLIGILACVGVFLYYPLNYWTLMGMETGLVAVFVLTNAWLALRWLRTTRTADLVGMSLAASFAFLARNDSLLLCAVSFIYVATVVYQRSRDRQLVVKVFYAGILFLLFPLGQTIFRYLYYGTLLPNTYTLKLTAFPLRIRLIGGAGFVLEFLQESSPVFILAAVCLLLERQRVAAFLFSFMLVAIGYQIYAGGDPWENWRLLAPAMPLLFILALRGAAAAVSRWKLLMTSRVGAASIISLLALGSLAATDLPFLADMSVQGPTSAAIANRVNTNSAIAINALTLPGASVGVIWAGTLPYYTDLLGVDFLGKSDPHVARLPADISGAVSWGGMISVPGHNKYDLDYSIVQLRPTYSQVFSWGSQTVKPWFVQNYVRVEYHAALGTKTVFLQKGSPFVCWVDCQAQYKIIPWPVQK